VTHDCLRGENQSVSCHPCCRVMDHPTGLAGQRNASAKACDRVVKFRVCRGRSLSSWPMASKCRSRRRKRRDDLVFTTESGSVMRRLTGAAVSTRPVTRPGLIPG
jgi:hypothetical protein